MHHAYAASKVSEGRLVLVTGTWRAVVCETEAMPRPVAKVFVEKSLIGTVETCAIGCHGLKRPIVTHVRCEYHDTAVEAVGPTDVRSRGKGVAAVEQFVGCTESNAVGINVYYPPELFLFP